MKIGDRVEIINVGTGDVPVGTKGVITYSIGEDCFKVDAEDDYWYYSARNLKLLSPEPKGKCLPDAAQDLYVALRGLTEIATSVEDHLMIGTYQRALLKALHVAQKALYKAENGEPAKGESLLEFLAREGRTLYRFDF